MVAPLSVYAVDTDDKTFVNVSKLSGSSTWVLFVGSLSVALISVREEVNKKASELFMYVKERFKDMSESDEALEQGKRAFRRTKGAMSAEEFSTVNSALFKILYETTSNTLVSIKNKGVNSYFGQGVEYLLYLHGRFGVVGVNQTKITFDIMNAKQYDKETPAEYGTRLQNTNSEITPPIAEPLLIQIFVKGLWDIELKKYLLREMDHITTVDDAIQKSTAQEVQQCIVDGDEYNIHANWAGRGKGKGKGKGKGGKGKPGGRGNGYGNASCDACGQQSHFWRSCFKLYSSLRPSWVTQQQHRDFDQKRSEIMSRATPENRRRYIEYASTINDPLATMQEFQNIDVNSAAVTPQQQQETQPQQQGQAARAEFPGLVASVNIEEKPQEKERNLAEIIALGFGVISLICAHAKKGWYSFIVKPILIILSCLFTLAVGVGAMSLFVGILYQQIVGANALKHASPSVATESWVGASRVGSLVRSRRLSGVLGFSQGSVGCSAS